MLKTSPKERIYARILGSALVAAGALGFIAGRVVAPR